MYNESTMKPANTNRFRSAIIAIVAVALIAALGILGLRYVAPDSPPADQPTNSAGQETNNQTGGEQDSSTANEDNQPPENLANTTEIAIENSAYQPSLITVEQGTTVIWTNEDSKTHTVKTESSPGPDSEPLAEGETYSYTFEEAGTFNYFSEQNPEVRGTIQVVD